MSEAGYIRKRKLQAAFVSLCFYACRMFPIKPNLISVCSFEGKGGFGCNPKYLIMELHKQHPELEIVWFVNDMSKSFPAYIKKVHNTLWNRAYWLSRSRVWIDNYRKPYGTKKREGQFYLNVNHFTLGIKCTGLLRGKGFSEMAYLVSKNDSDMIDALVIDSKWCEECFEKAMLYSGFMLKTGAPRCDVLYGNRKMQRRLFRRRHDLSDDVKVVMYAPTFREGAKQGKRYVYSKKCSLDFKKLLNNLRKKFGGEWVLCLRLHPQLSGGLDNAGLKNEPWVINESQYDDFYELLAGMDAYITDYSSAIFEAGFAGIPAFIYADDIQEYHDARGELYWDFSENVRKDAASNITTHPGRRLQLPFSLAHNNDQLAEDILGFGFEKYIKDLNLFGENIELLYDGKASIRVADYLYSVCFM